jgi:hypothetical protein
MGIINHDPYIFESGITLSDCYLSFTSGLIPFPNTPLPISLSYVVEGDRKDRKKNYEISAMMYIHLNHAEKIAGSPPIDKRLITISADIFTACEGDIVTAIFMTLYMYIAKEFPNSERA